MPIFDQGYQHWKGRLSGHAWRWLAITKQGLRGQFKSRLVRMVLLLAWLPALADGNISATTCLWGPRNAAVTTPTLRVRSEAWGGWRLSGAVDFVADADLADHLVVSATAAGEQVMAFVVPLTAAGLWIDPLRLMGGHRTFRIGFDDVEVIDPAAVLDGAELV